jgi:hypothetical protein
MSDFYHWLTGNEFIIGLGRFLTLTALGCEVYSAAALFTRERPEDVASRDTPAHIY